MSQILCYKLGMRVHCSHITPYPEVIIKYDLYIYAQRWAIILTWSKLLDIIVANQQDRGGLCMESLLFLCIVFNYECRQFSFSLLVFSLRPPILFFPSLLWTEVADWLTQQQSRPLSCLLPVTKGSRKPDISSASFPHSWGWLYVLLIVNEM